MIEKFDLAGYCRISVDEELDRSNASIENQKAIIEDFVKRKFPGSALTFYEDRDKSGYTFDQRRQADGKRVCAAPYGYIINKRQEFEIVPTEAEIVRESFHLYIDGWGYKKIANHLTNRGIPTPRMAEWERKEALEETYDELESDLRRRIEGIQNQIAMTQDNRNTIIQVNRAAKTSMEVFDDILSKPKLDRNDLQLIIEKIKVYEAHIEIQLKSDVDSILRCGELPEELTEEQPETVAAFAPTCLDRPEKAKPYEIQIIQESDKHKSEGFTVKVVSNGDPSLTTLKPWKRFCYGVMELAKGNRQNSRRLARERRI